MRVLLVLPTVLALNITQFSQYEIIFAKNCSQYLIYQGTTDYMYMQQSNNKTQLWIQQNNSYAIFAGELNDPVTFSWNNGVLHMTRVLGDGLIIYPLHFTSEVFLCPIASISARESTETTAETTETTTLETATTETCPVTYKCKTTPIWVYPIAVIGFAFLVTVILYGKLSGTEISRLVEWGSYLYTRIRQQQGSE